MVNKNKKKRIGTVYSTNDDYDYSYENEQEEETLPNNEQYLEAHIEKKGRGGKSAVVVKGFIGTDDDLQTLGKLLKKKCGVGGSCKDGEIIIQGDARDKVIEILKKENYHVKRVGG